jgi:hypothetical protein
MAVLLDRKRKVVAGLAVPSVYVKRDNHLAGSRQQRRDAQRPTLRKGSDEGCGAWPEGRNRASLLVRECPLLWALARILPLPVVDVDMPGQAPTAISGWMARW